MMYPNIDRQSPKQPVMQWTWYDCNLTLKRNNKHSQIQVYEILQSEYNIQLQQDGSQAELAIEILMEKKINFEQESGFTWHKSWNIPILQVKISKKDLSAVKTQLGISRIFCEITAGYPLRRKTQYYVQEVTLQGQNKREITSNGSVRFNNLKFSETSFNHQRRKFSLIVMIYAKNEEKSRSMIKSFISTSIYVDSRKEARKKNASNSFISELIPPQIFVQPLDQRHLDKKVVKNKSKMSHKESQQKISLRQIQIQRKSKHVIEYSLAGFINYYSSANIRNKIKHPFYFSYHFYHLITICYNQQAFSNPLDLLKQLQKPHRPDCKKILMIKLTPLNQQQQASIESFRKKIQALFENWKFFFIEVFSRNSPIFNHALNQKIGEETQHRWKELSKEDVINTYQEFYNQMVMRERQDSGKESQPQKHMKEAEKKFEHYELHQSVNIQHAFDNRGSKRVKMEEYEEEYY